MLLAITHANPLGSIENLGIEGFQLKLPYEDTAVARDFYLRAAQRVNRRCQHQKAAEAIWRRSEAGHWVKEPGEFRKAFWMWQCFGARKDRRES